MRRIEPWYHSNGEIGGALCIIRHFLAVGQDFRDPVYPSCPAGYIRNGNNASGCQLFVPRRALGKCTEQCGKDSLAAKGDPNGGPTAGNPIALAVGNKFEQVTDYRSGGTNALTFTRYYNSQARNRGMLGPGWRHSFERSLLFINGSRTDYHAADGKVYVFNKVGNDWVPDSDVVLRLTQQGNDWELVDQRDQVERFAANGRLLSITERNGYQQALEYFGPGGKLSLVHDSHGQRLRFAYDGNGQLDSVAAPDGHRYHYEYRKLYDFELQPATLLERVVYPDDTPLDRDDNPRVQYLYEDPDFPIALTGVIDETGARYATWSYDEEGRAISSEHAGGTDSYAITYHPDGSRTVTNPLGKQTVYRFTTINGVPRLQQIERLAGPQTLAATADLTYDANGFLSSTTDWEGNVTSYVHDSRGLITSLTEAVGTPEERNTTTTWHNDFRLPTQIVAPRQTTDLTYDTDGLLIARTVTDTTGHMVPYSTNGQSRSWGFTYSTGGTPPGGPAPLPDVPLTLINPDAETGDTTGWTVTEGTFTVNSSNPSPIQGTYYFYGGDASPASRMHQDVAIPSGNWSEVDSGERAIRLSWEQRNFNGFDEGTVVVRFLDAADQLIGSSYEYLWSRAAAWTSRSFVLDAPPLTRKVQVELRAFRTGGTANNAYFDELSLDLVARSDRRQALALQNADAEAGNTSGWTNESGGFVVSSSAQRPVQGDYFFYAGSDSKETIYQDVAIPSDQHASVDLGNREIALSWWQSSFNGNDTGRAILQFLDAAGRLVGEPVESLALAPTSWTKRSLTAAIPANTRTVRFKLRGYLSEAPYNNAYFDHVSAHLIYTDVPQLPLPRQLVSLDGPRSDVTDTVGFTYDTFSELETVTDALGHVSSITARDGRGLPLTLLDENGIETELSYDPRGRLVSSRVKGAAGDAVTTFGYNAADLLVAVTLPDGQQLLYEYDAAQRLTAVANARGERMEYTLDAMGNVTGDVLRSDSGAIVRSQTRVYDELGRLLQQVGAASQTTSFGYDLNSNQTSITDPLNGPTTQAFDGLDRLVQMIDPLSGITGYGYDAQDNLVTVTDQRGLVTTYTHNGFGEVIQLESPDTGATVYTLDPAGNVLSQTDARGRVTAFTYDALNRPLTRSYPATPAEDVTYSYDDTTLGNRGIGRLTSLTDRTGSTSLTYDDYGHLVAESRSIGGVVYVTRYDHDVAGNLLRVVYPDGRIVSYGRDELGRATSILTQADAAAAPVVVASDIVYEPFGPVSGLTFGNGVALDYTYDQDYRLTGIVAGDGVTSVQDLTLAYDNADNITAITDALDASRSQSFQYDDLYRLTQAIGLYGTIDYGYDAVGNRTSRTIDDAGGLLTETYTYDTASNRLLSLSDGLTTQSFSYGASGQITGDDRGLSDDLGFVYDDSDRLVQLQVAGLAETDYRHNAFGERVSKEMLATNAITHFHYGAGGQLLGESDELGVFQRSYIYLDGLPIAQIEPLGGGGGAQSDQSLDNDSPDAIALGNWVAETALSGHEGVDYLVHPGAEPVPVGGVVLDNTSPDFSTTGLWPAASTLPGFEGANYQARSANGPFAPVLEVDNHEPDVTIAGPWNHTVRLQGGHSGPNYLWRTPNGVSAETIYLDNDGPEFATTGFWLVGTWTGGGQPYGGDFLFIDPSADPADTLTVDNASPGLSTYGSWNSSTWTGGGQPLGPDWRWLHATSVSPDAIRVDNLSAGFSVSGSPWTASTTTENGRLVGSDYLLLNEQVAPPGAEVIDNTDPGATAVGVWSTSTDSSDRYGGNYFYKAVGTGSESFTWTPTIGQSGDFEVLTFFPNGEYSVTDATFTVHHAGGSTSVVVNQQTGGGRWVPLGTFSFDPGSNHRIELSDTGTGSWVVADAVQIRPVGTAPNTATWTPDIPVAKQYEVYAWWTSNSARATDATYTVYHDGGSTDVVVNQKQGRDQWNLLGTFALSPGSNHRVELTNQADGRVVADAVQFFPVDGTHNTATWTPEFPSSQDYNVYARWSAHSSRAQNATYRIHHAGGSSDAVVDQRNNGGQWTLLGTYSFAPGSNHRVELTNVARGTTIADGVKFEPVNPDPSNPPPTAIWTPDIPATREYAVYAYWSAGANRPADATYVVHHAGGVSPVVVDQKGLGGQWNLLGTYTFNPASDHRIELALASGRTVADAIRLIPTDGAPNSVTWALNVPDNEFYTIETRWIIRDGRATNAPYTVNHAGGSDTVLVDQSATWREWVSLGNYLIPGDASGSVVLTDQADGIVQADAVRLTPITSQVRTATWAYTPLQSGDYRVFARWPEGPDHATNAKYTVQHTGGSTVVTVSQAQRGGQWNELGVFSMEGGLAHGITLSDDANGVVVADALYIVKAEPLADVVTWVPTLPSAGRYQVYAKWTSDETRATDARYSIVHDGGTTAVTRNQRAGGGSWQYLGSYSFDPLLNPSVSLAANDNGSVAADAVRFVGGPAGATDVAYLHTDHLGTPQAMTDAGAQLLWWRDQTPFGQTVDTGGFSQTPIRFPGQFADDESGLHYNYFRDYDPALGRYVQSDPIGLEGGLNTYGYVRGNPLRYKDPFGLQEAGVLTCPAGGPLNPVCVASVVATACKWIIIGGVSILLSSDSCDDESCPAYTDIEGKPPFEGEPGSTVRGETGSRTYGPDGFPLTDRDWPHPNHRPPGCDDHCHDWDRPSDGEPPTHTDRGRPRTPRPGDPPAPRGPNTPIPK